ncbi:hypothetical protein PRIPAC_78407 [Pristionchus pacificus]|uniref:Serpentine receptor class gamma n=1 Tax=Pristionchus pacificus TaxID=54126 RepID=A0A2A6CQL7_PRIPA|nr:hypothetical protein PRIPAC_78407 [Pristionchus pacificus]|eukprot:PDM80439.1 G protein-coupled receptor [Pristionchus pacificus]
MANLLTEILECVCTFLYALLIIRIWLSNDVYFSTPFYKFFITTGICGILSVVSFMFGIMVNLTAPWAWILKVCWVINHIGAVGSLLGKLIISVNRYGVLRSPDLAENKWTRSLIYRLVALQFLLPCTSAIKVVFYDYKYEMRNGIEVAYTYTDTGIVSSKAITTTYYIVYVVLSVLLMVLTSRSLMQLSEKVGEGNAKRQILRHHRIMFIIVSICVASHLVKALHQAVWCVSTLMGDPELADAIYPYYSYANGFATYAAPVVLIICSAKVRGLFLSRFRSYSASVNTTGSAFRSNRKDSVSRI